LAASPGRLPVLLTYQIQTEKVNRLVAYFVEKSHKDLTHQIEFATI
jgi:hypothetical protein